MYILSGNLMDSVSYGLTKAHYVESDDLSESILGQIKLVVWF